MSPEQPVTNRGVRRQLDDLNTLFWNNAPPKEKKHPL